jgi:hypothetical protein
MDRLGREYLPEELVEYYKRENMGRNELLELMEIIPFLHRNGLMPFIEMLKVMYKDQGITPGEMRAHFTALVAHVSQDQPSPWVSKPSVRHQAAGPQTAEERPANPVAEAQTFEGNTNVGRSTTPAKATGGSKKPKTNSLGS